MLIEGDTSSLEYGSYSYNLHTGNYSTVGILKAAKSQTKDSQAGLDLPNPPSLRKFVPLL